MKHQTEPDPTRVATHICEVMATLDAELGIAVAVARDRVLLSGVVASGERRRRAAARARMVCPSHEIVNKLEVRPGSRCNGEVPTPARLLLPGGSTVITNAITGVCEVCGNEYDRSFRVIDGHGSHVFDCFECAIHGLAPRCAHCGCTVIGHGVEADDGAVYCCAHCAASEGVRGVVDHVHA